MALNLSGTSGIVGAGIGTIDASGANVTGVGTFTSVSVSGGVDASSSTVTANQLTLSTDIVHSGDTNTKIRFPSADVISFENAGTETARASATNQFSVGTTADVTGASVSIGASMRLVNATGNTATITAMPGGTYNTGVSGGSAIAFHRISEGGGGSDEIAFETHHQGSSHAESLRIEKAGDIKVNRGDLYFGTAAKGIVLGATSNTDANTLDDYEEGTFTPALTNGYSSITYNNQYGFYTKIGRFVSYSIYLYVQGATGDNAEIRINTPFTTANTTGLEEGGSIVYQLNFLSTSDDNKTNSYVFTGKNMSYLRLVKNNNGAVIFGNDTTLGTGGNNVYLLIKGFLTTS